MSNNRIKTRNTNRQHSEYNVGYITDAVRVSERNEHVINGAFPQANSAKDVAIKKVNNTLCGMLLCAILVSTISYFFVVTSEIKLNECSRKTTLLNVENAELENKLDKLKSFNNVDLTMQKNNLLQRPEKVIDVTQPENDVVNQKKNTSSNLVKPKAWAIGY